MSAPLPPNDNPSFAADYAGAIVYPAHPTNYARGAPLAASMGGICLHTPEEDADDIEVTPRWFAQDHGDPARAGSTTYYVDSDGDVYQCVSEDWMHFGNGVKGKPWPAWADPNINLNWQTISIEIEGRAASIQDTLVIGGPQWLSLVALIRDRGGFYRIPLDREHVIGHYEVSNERSDPGAGFPWHALMEELMGKEENYPGEVNEHRAQLVVIEALMTGKLKARFEGDAVRLSFDDDSWTTDLPFAIPEWGKPT